MRFTHPKTNFKSLSLHLLDAGKNAMSGKKLSTLRLHRWNSLKKTQRNFGPTQYLTSGSTLCHTKLSPANIINKNLYKFPARLVGLTSSDVLSRKQNLG